MNVLDKIIGYISPETAYKRAAWRWGTRQFYEAGKVTNSAENWRPQLAKAEQMNQAERDFIRARARDRERNSDIVQSIVRALERNVVGTGFRVQSTCSDEKLGDEFEKLFDEWSKPRNCDVTQQMSFWEMCKLIVRRRSVDGGILFVKTYSGNKKYPFQLQAREVDDLDTALTISPSGNQIINGVEVNSYQRPVAYYLKKYSADGWFTGETERIPAQRVIALWSKTMPSQVREVSEMATMITRVNDVDDYIHTVSMKEKILASMAVFIKSLLPAGSAVGLGRNNAAKKSEYGFKTIVPGMVQKLNPGDDVVSVIPSGQAQNARDYISTIQRMVGSSMGLSYETVTRDMSYVNYSSARQNLLEDQKTFLDWQKWLIDHFLQEVFTEVIISAKLAGTIDIADFWDAKDDYLSHRWIAPGWSWIDPQKEVSANQTAVESGQENLINICARAGLDYREVLDGQAKVLKYKKDLEEKYDIKFDGGTSTNGGQETNTADEQNTAGGSEEGQSDEEAAGDAEQSSDAGEQQH